MHFSWRSSSIILQNLTTPLSIDWAGKKDLTVLPLCILEKPLKFLR